MKKRARKRPSRSVKRARVSKSVQRREQLLTQEIREEAGLVQMEQRQPDFNDFTSADLIQELYRRGQSLERPAVMSYYTGGEEPGQECIYVNVEPAVPVELSFDGVPVYEDLESDLQNYTGRLSGMSLPVFLARRISESLNKTLSELSAGRFEGVPSDFWQRIINRGPDRSKAGYDEVKEFANLKEEN